jgi:succinylglutamic semialdehyde dehydrogenase
VEERVAYLETFAKIVTSEIEPFAEVIAKETGKTLWDARNEVQGMINKVKISIEAYKQRCPTRQQPVPQGMLQTLHRPHGVMAVLGPYNFPGHLPNGHIVPALLAGNTILFKPSELTPLAGEYAAQCWEKAQLPPRSVQSRSGRRRHRTTPLRA